MKRNSKASGVKTTATSLTVLELINDRGGARLPELVEQLDMSKSTVHAHLATLREHGYLVKEGEIYRLGLKLLYLGNCERNTRRFYPLVQQKVAELAVETGEEVEFDVEENGIVFSVYSELGNSNDPTFQPGRRFHLHTVATGKAMLAELPDSYVQRVIEEYGLPKETEHTITSESALREEVEAIHQQGYAINDQELRNGLCAVGAAIRYPTGELFGGLSVGGPTYRVKDSDLTTRLRKSLLETVDELEHDLAESNATDNPISRPHL